MFSPQLIESHLQQVAIKFEAMPSDTVNNLLFHLMAAIARQYGDASTREMLTKIFNPAITFLMAEYMNGSKIGEQVARIIKALRNESDPWVAEMGMMERQAMWMLLNTLEGMKNVQS